MRLSGLGKTVCRNQLFPDISKDVQFCFDLRGLVRDAGIASSSWSHVVVSHSRSPTAFPRILADCSTSGRLQNVGECKQHVLLLQKVETCSPNSKSGRGDGDAEHGCGSIHFIASTTTLSCIHSRIVQPIDCGKRELVSEAPRRTCLNDYQNSGFTSHQTVRPTDAGLPGSFSCSLRSRFLCVASSSHRADVLHSFFATPCFVAATMVCRLSTLHRTVGPDSRHLSIF
ncbi:hypothetical protein Y032_0025g1121 [Ancylostoma ceylanicum]|uniref:Uncharacterized protein n=1 Tax=Ancylostoma ceylanicum TaxID=53326 RepID=A0A016UW93_9BILA|nr:hypothetical protein Y032_0025g1121 [Ancylostoma ceylanicum]